MSLKKILLHTCCAPCSVKCLEVLSQEGFIPTAFWYNPNIHPWTEYSARKTAFLSYAKELDIQVIVNDSYGLETFIRDIYPDFSRNRCEYCYKERLRKTAQCALENGYKLFSTTLLISPYQNHEMIKTFGNELADEYSLEFVYRDFRPFFRDGQRRAREIGMYMQKYCGCIFSEKERYMKN